MIGLAYGIALFAPMFLLLAVTKNIQSITKRILVSVGGGLVLGVGGANALALYEFFSCPFINGCQ